MEPSLHIVCPHCDTINRVPRAKLDKPDSGGGRCGQCHEALFDGHPVALDTARFERHLDEKRHPAADRFLGAVVRAVPDDGARVRARRRAAGTCRAAGQGQCRRGAGAGGAVSGAEHPDPRARLRRPRAGPRRRRSLGAAARRMDTGGPGPGEGLIPGRALRSTLLIPRGGSIPDRRHPAGLSYRAADLRCGRGSACICGPIRTGRGRCAPFRPRAPAVPRRWCRPVRAHPSSAAAAAARPLSRRRAPCRRHRPGRSPRQRIGLGHHRFRFEGETPRNRTIRRKEAARVRAVHPCAFRDG